MLALGKRLDIAAGTAIRFEPGDVRTVTLVSIGGGANAKLSGGNSLARGRLEDMKASPAKLEEIQARIRAEGYRDEPAPVGQSAAPASPPPASARTPASPSTRKSRLMEQDAIFGLLQDSSAPSGGPTSSPSQANIRPTELSREVYMSLYGPTVGDRVRLGDTNLWVEVERDLCTETAGYGDECKFGGGKVLRDGMGQSSGRSDAETLDTVIINALVIDWTGIFKADIGIKRGLISGIGKAGNPDIMDGVTAGMIVGSCTEVIAGERMILTAGAMDAHVHYICPELIPEALASGITTLVGGGTGPSSGTSATTCTPGKWNLEMMFHSTDHFPLNFAFTGKGNDSEAKALEEQIEAGCFGLKIHEDWGATPATIDACLTVSDKYDVQTNIHTDTLNESGFLETTLAAIKGRTIHTYRELRIM